MNFLFKGAPAEGEGVGLDGKGDPGLPGAPGFQVHTSEKIFIILHLSLSLSLSTSFFLFFLSLFLSLYLSHPLKNIFHIHVSPIYIFHFILKLSPHYKKLHC